jgi:hypothetical protein
MPTAIAHQTLPFRRLLPPDFEVSLSWDWDDDWAWGYCSTFADLGAATLVLGPLHVRFDWAIW